MIALLHVDLVVRDIDRSLPFYVNHFGCSVVEDTVVTGPVPEFYTAGRSSSMRLVFLKASSALFGVMIELMQFGPGVEAPPPVDAAAPTGNLTFMVDDVARTLADLDGAGVRPASGVMDVALPKSGAARIAFVRDPDGHLIEILERVPAARG
jgi:catechol 2,3-dioxygenase-like lactoylglutathione lyase family enzyme